MPAPKLVHEATAGFVAGTATQVGTAVPAARARVGKLIVACRVSSGTVNVNLYAGPGVGGDPATKAIGVVLGPGEVYTEANLVLLAGEVVSATVSTANGVAVSFQGEEVDN